MRWNLSPRVSHELAYAKSAVMRKEGEGLIVEPVPAKSLLAVLATLTPLDEEFPEFSDPRPRAVEISCVTCSIRTSSRR
jgi:hypothetical protein